MLTSHQKFRKSSPGRKSKFMKEVCMCVPYPLKVSFSLVISQFEFSMYESVCQTDGPLFFAPSCSKAKTFPPLFSQIGAHAQGPPSIDVCARPSECQYKKGRT